MYRTELGGGTIVKVTLIATDRVSGETVVIEADGADEAAARAAARAQVPEGWRTVSVREHKG